MTLRKLILFVLTIVILIGNGYAQNALLIPYRQGVQWGYCDTGGVIKIKPQYDSVTFFKTYDSITKVYKNKKVSMITTKGKVIFPFCDSIQFFINKLYILVKKNKSGLYDINGKEVIPVLYDSLKNANNYIGYKGSGTQMVGFKKNKYFLLGIDSNYSKEISAPVKKKDNFSYGVANSQAYEIYQSQKTMSENKAKIYLHKIDKKITYYTFLSLNKMTGYNDIFNIYISREGGKWDMLGRMGNNILMNNVSI